MPYKVHKNPLAVLQIKFKDLVFTVLVFSIFFLIFAGKTLGDTGSTKYFLIKTASGEEFIYQKDYSGKVSIKSGGHNYLIFFKNGKVKILKSDCQDRLCVNYGYISRPGEKIICLPGNLIISCIGETRVDALNR